MKRGIFLFLILCFLLTACGKSEEPASSGSDSTIDVSKETQAAEPSGTDSSLSYPESLPQVIFSSPESYEALNQVQSAYTAEATLTETAVGMPVYTRTSHAGAVAFSDYEVYSFYDLDETHSVLQQKICFFGDYLYALTGSDFVVLQPEEDGVQLLGTYSVVSNDLENEYPSAITIQGNMLCILTEETSGLQKVSTCIHLKRYLLSNPENPVLTDDIRLEGSNISCCTGENGFLLITYDSGDYADTGDGEAVLPTITRNGENRFLTLDELQVPQSVCAAGYTVLTYIPYDSGMEPICSAISGYFPYGTITETGLYLAGSGTILQSSEAYRESQYNVTAYRSVSVTRVLQIDPETLVLQNASQYEGCFDSGAGFTMTDSGPMLGLLKTSYYFRSFYDETYGFENYLFDQTGSGSSLIRMNNSLECLEITDAGVSAAIEFSAGTAWIFRDTDGFFPSQYAQIDAESLSFSDCENLTVLPIQVLKEEDSRLLCLCYEYQDTGDYYDYAIAYVDSETLAVQEAVSGIDPELILFAQDASLLLLRINDIPCLYAYGADGLHYVCDTGITYLSEAETSLIMYRDKLCIVNGSALYVLNENYEITETISFAMG